MADMFRVTYKNGEVEDVDEETLNAIEPHITKAEPIVIPSKPVVAPQALIAQKVESPSIVSTAKDMLGDYFKHLPFVNDEGYVIQPKAKAGIKATGQYIQEHPAETALGVASIPFAPTTILGAMLLGGSAAGARAFDKTNPFVDKESDYKTRTLVDNAVDIGGSGAMGLAGGLAGATVSKIANATKAINQAPKDWKVLEDAKDLAYETAVANKAKETEALSRFSDRASKSNAFNDVASKGSKNLGDESYKYYWEDMRSRVGNYLEHSDPRYMYGGTRYGMKPSDDVVASYIEKLDAPVVREAPSSYPKGLDLTTPLPNWLRTATSEVSSLNNNRLIPKLLGAPTDALRNSMLIPASRLPVEHTIRSKGRELRSRNRLGYGLADRLEP